jgi:hypothetical protein
MSDTTFGCTDLARLSLLVWPLLLTLPLFLAPIVPATWVPTNQQQQQQQQQHRRQAGDSRAVDQ